jgi:signal transduction histidine kinase
VNDETLELLPAMERDNLHRWLELLEREDLESMLRDALSTALETVGAESGSLLLVRRRTYRVTAGLLRRDAVERIDKWEQDLSSRLLDSASVLSEPREDLPLHVEALSGGEVTLVSIPLLNGNEIVGLASFFLPQGGEVGEGQKEELSVLARIIGRIASILVDLLDSRQRVRQSELFLKIYREMSSLLDLNQLLEDTVNLARTVTQAAAGSLMLVDDERQELIFTVASGEKRETLRETRIELNEGIAGWVAANGEPLIVNDVSREPRFNAAIDRSTGFLTHSVICVPLKIKGRTIGIIELLNKLWDERFDDEDLNFLRSLGAQAAIAIENAQLYQRLQEERDRIIEAQEEVRREIARNLHDGTVQSLSILAMNLEIVERLMKTDPEAASDELERMRQTILRTIEEARTLMFQLRPVVLETQGLVPALREYVAQLQDREAFQVHIEAEDLSDELDKKVEGTIFAIVQEAVNNARKHADAQNVSIRLEKQEDAVAVTIDDDGKGFDLHPEGEDADRHKHFGLINMRERARLIQGQFSLESRRGEGTTVELRVPLQ